MITINKIQHRNLEEQVRYNTALLELLPTGFNSENFVGIIERDELDKIKSGQFALVKTDPFEEDYPYELFYRQNETEIANFGEFPKPGPRGPVGESLAGPQGPAGPGWRCGNFIPEGQDEEGTLFFNYINQTVYEYKSGSWIERTSLRGSQGPAGRPGESVTGPAGPRGPIGPRGVSGASYTIIGTVDNEGQLPSPVGLKYSYVVKHGSAYDLYIPINNEWVNVGAVTPSAIELLHEKGYSLTAAMTQAATTLELDALQESLNEIRATADNDRLILLGEINENSEAISANTAANQNTYNQMVTRTQALGESITREVGNLQARTDEQINDLTKSIATAAKVPLSITQISTFKIRGNILPYADTFEEGIAYSSFYTKVSDPTRSAYTISYSPHLGTLYTNNASGIYALTDSGEEIDFTGQTTLTTNELANVIKIRLNVYNTVLSTTYLSNTFNDSLSYSATLPTPPTPRNPYRPMILDINSNTREYIFDSAPINNTFELSVFANFKSGNSFQLYFDNSISSPEELVPDNRYYITLGSDNLEINLGTTFLSTPTSGARRFEISLTRSAIEITAYSSLESECGNLHYLFNPWNDSGSIPYIIGIPPYVRVEGTESLDASVLIIYSQFPTSRNYAFILPTPPGYSTSDMVDYTSFAINNQILTLASNRSPSSYPYLINYIKSSIAALPSDTIYIYHPFTTSSSELNSPYDLYNQIIYLYPDLSDQIIPLKFNDWYPSDPSIKCLDLSSPYISGSYCGAYDLYGIQNAIK